MAQARQLKCATYAWLNESTSPFIDDALNDRKPVQAGQHGLLGRADLLDSPAVPVLFHCAAHRVQHYSRHDASCLFYANDGPLGNAGRKRGANVDAQLLGEDRLPNEVVAKGILQVLGDQRVLEPLVCIVC